MWDNLENLDYGTSKAACFALETYFSRGGGEGGKGFPDIIESILLFKVFLVLIFSNPFNVPTQLISQLKEQIGLLMIRLSTFLPISFKSIQFRQCTRYLTIYPSANLSHQLTI